MGIGLLPRCVVAEDIEQGRLVQQSVTGAPYRFSSTVIWPKEVDVSARLLAFLQSVEISQSDQKQNNRYTAKRQRKKIA